MSIRRRPPASVLACTAGMALAVLATGCSDDDFSGLSVVSGPFVFSGEANRLNAYYPKDGFAKQTVIENADLDPEGRDINGQICFHPDGSQRFIAGEDTGQPNPPAGWGFFQLTGGDMDGLSAFQVGKLAPTYVSDDPENYGCGFLSDGRLLTTDVGNQAAGFGNGQLILWFPPLDTTNARFYKLDIAIPTAGGIQVDGDSILVASARGDGRREAGIYRYSGPFPTSDDASGGCGQTDPTGAPLADEVRRDRLIGIDGNILSPNAVVRSPAGTLYVSSVLNGVIAEYDAEGRFIRRILTPPAGETLPFSTGSPLGLGVDSSGSVYYADIGLTGQLSPGPDLGTLRRIRFAGGNPLPPETLDTQLNFPDGIGILE